jgi:DNA-directed RNA polymerase specialized sigma subunit
MVINIDNSSKDDGGTELESIIEFFKSINSDDLVEEEDEDEIIKLKKSKKKESPNIDQILDKIVDKGMNSLTKKEKKILDNYADGK